MPSQLGWLLLKRQNVMSAGEEMEKGELSQTSGGNVRSCSHVESSTEGTLKMRNRTTTQTQLFLSLGVLLTFLAALLTTLRHVVSLGDQRWRHVKQQWSRSTVEPHSAIKRLESCPPQQYGWNYRMLP